MTTRTPTTTAPMMIFILEPELVVAKDKEKFRGLVKILKLDCSIDLLTVSVRLESRRERNKAKALKAARLLEFHFHSVITCCFSSAGTSERVDYLIMDTKNSLFMNNDSTQGLAVTYPN